MESVDLSTSTRRPQNCKTAHFITWMRRERLRNEQKLRNARAKRSKAPFVIVKYANLESLIKEATTSRTTSENVTSRFCNRVSIIPRLLAWQMFTYYPGIKYVRAIGRFRREESLCRQAVMLSTHQLPKRSFHVTERTRTTVKNVQK